MTREMIGRFIEGLKLCWSLIFHAGAMRSAFSEVRVVEVSEGKFNVYMPRDAYATLERLMIATGKNSMGETLRAAIEWYDEEKAKLVNCPKVRQG